MLLTKHVGDQSEKNETGGRMWHCGGEEKRIQGFEEENRELSDADTHIYMFHYLHYFI